MGEWNSWHIQYKADGAGLSLLTPAERLQAETELLLALEAPADPRPLLGLAYLSSRKALPGLNRCFSSQSQHAWTTHALRAIAAIDPYALDQQQLLRQLAHGRPHASPFSDPLIDILLGLRLYFPLSLLERPVIDQIFQLMRHKKALVRSHALQTLRELYALPTAAQETATDLERSTNDPVFQLISPDDRPADYDSAIRLLRQQTENIALI
ncbi:hypothetical protein MTP16_00215 [Hymenobacter monticola]|uniref:HEAT repeat domain-containing protein n=2 Tax=Hymenobacter monticola TaxID=1705399 RepID=A0ABY4B7X2_9BACT|nr:hypothetical protein [Hymenobacter monticola]UOE34091.1 hypothetical protein MTP16_00215 [Hymenobacter monticola]